MESLSLSALLWLMAVASGLMAGTYLAFSMVVMPSLASIGTREAVTAMNSINRTIIKTAFMPLFFGSTGLAFLLIIAGGWYWGQDQGMRAFISGMLYVVGMFIVTAVKNVPLNNRLDQVAAHDERAEQIWQDYLQRWTRWNHVRTVACALTLILCLEVS